MAFVTAVGEIPAWVQKGEVSAPVADNLLLVSVDVSCRRCKNWEDSASTAFRSGGVECQWERTPSQDVADVGSSRSCWILLLMLGRDS